MKITFLDGHVENIADLYRANLSGADLYRANLYGANLSGANLSGANLSGADLYGANLSGAKIGRAQKDSILTAIHIQIVD